MVFPRRFCGVIFIYSVSVIFINIIIYIFIIINIIINIIIIIIGFFGFSEKAFVFLGFCKKLSVFCFRKKLFGFLGFLGKSFRFFCFRKKRKNAGKATGKIKKKRSKDCYAPFEDC